MYVWIFSKLDFTSTELEEEERAGGRSTVDQ